MSVIRSDEENEKQRKKIQDKFAEAIASGWCVYEDKDKDESNKDNEDKDE